MLHVTKFCATGSFVHLANCGILTSYRVVASTESRGCEHAGAVHGWTFLGAILLGSKRILRLQMCQGFGLIGLSKVHGA